MIKGKRDDELVGLVLRLARTPHAEATARGQPPRGPPSRGAILYPPPDLVGLSLSHQLGLPQDVVDRARNHRDLGPAAEKHVLDAIQEYEAAIAKIKDEISALDLPKQWFTRDKLMEEMQPLQARLNACKRLLSLERRVPLDTMRKIFGYYLLPRRGPIIWVPGKNGEFDEAWCVGDDDEHAERGWFGGSNQRVKNHPGVLCLVCRHWRTIATSTPSLWSKIEFSAYQAGRDTQGSVGVPAPRVRGIWSWMDRISGQPWELTITLGENSGPPSMQEEVREYLPLPQVLRHSAVPQLKRLKISGTPTLLALTGLDKITIPEVTSAVIDRTAWSITIAGGGENSVEAALPYLPNLKHLTFNHLFCRVTDGLKSIPEQVPWSQLTHLALGGNLYVRHWRAVLRQCVKLQKGTFHLTGHFAYDVGEEREHVELRDLRELTTFRCSPFVEPLVNISLPSLETLRIYTWQSQPLVDFTNPSIFDSLTHLTLVSSGQVHGGYIISVVDRLPKLVELFFTMDHGLKEAYHFLTYGHEGKFKLRHLRTLGMHTWYSRETMDEDESFPFDALTSLVESRSQAVRENWFSPSTTNLAPLERFVLRLGATDRQMVLSSKVKESLKPFGSYGVNLTITVPWGSSRGDNPVSGRYYNEVWSRMLRRWPEEAGFDDMDRAGVCRFYP